MNDIVYLKHDEAMTDSLMVADSFGKRHDHVVRNIENLIDGLPKNGDTQKMFIKTWYKHEQNGQHYTKYLISRDGFSLLIMGFTGKKALQWKLKYIEAFNSMETIIREKSTETWIATREYGKLTRRAETDTIQKLVEYAKEQGSTHSEMLYMTYTKLANRMAGIEKRDEATIRQLNNVSLLEDVILHEIDKGIMTQKHYKEIYQDCKARLKTLNDLAYLQAV